MNITVVDSKDSFEGTPDVVVSSYDHGSEPANVLSKTLAAIGKRFSHVPVVLYFNKVWKFADSRMQTIKAFANGKEHPIALIVIRVFDAKLVRLLLRRNLFPRLTL